MSDNLYSPNEYQEHDECDECGKEMDERMLCIDLVGKGKLGIDRACGKAWCTDCYDKAQESVTPWYHDMAEDWDGDNNTDLCPSCARNPLGIEQWGVFVETNEESSTGEGGVTFEVVLPDDLAQQVWNYISSPEAFNEQRKVVTGADGGREFHPVEKGDTKAWGAFIDRDTGGLIKW